MHHEDCKPDNYILHGRRPAVLNCKTLPALQCVNETKQVVFNVNSVVATTSIFACHVLSDLI